MSYWVIPDALTEYFHTAEGWEEYALRYQHYRQALDPHTYGTLPVRDKRFRIRCKSCGKFMHNRLAYLEAGGQTWHLKEPCLMRAYDYLMLKNKLFDWTNRKWILKAGD
jgi:hypothetical protein